MGEYFPLQSFCWPSKEISADPLLYVRAKRSDKVLLTEEGIRFGETAEVELSTFFNAFSIAVWKKYCTVEDLSVCISGHGEAIVRIWHNSGGERHILLQEKRIYLDTSPVVSIGEWPNLSDGILYCSITALGDTWLKEGGFVTTAKPLNTVKLGMVITHFNRKQYVVPAIRRIQTELLQKSPYSDAMSLTVVDNSQNITTEEACGATVIPNANLGGSGGFTRGLLHLKDEGSFTHCLFMDDDASCELESIRRTYAFFQYAAMERTAVAGSLLSENEDYRLIEKGAYFGRSGKGLKAGLDMRENRDLLMAETEEPCNYGAWWFFAFRIGDVRSFPFPFFVRGDDILFGTMNRFAIATMNGIGCWGEDFGIKDGPMPRYLDTRQILVQRIRQEGISPFSTAGFLLKLFVASLFSYNYASASAVTLGIRDFLKGPEFWTANMDMSKIRPVVGRLSPSEKMEPIDIGTLDFEEKNGASFIRKICVLLTLNGLLLPSFFLKKKIVYQPKSFRASFGEVFRYRKILYYDQKNKTGYIAVLDKKRFLKEVLMFVIEAGRVLLKYRTVQSQYIDALPYMTSETFWRNIYPK